MSSEREARLPRVMVISDEQVWSRVGSDRMELASVGLVTPAEFAALDLVLFIGPMTDLQRGLELAGVMKLAFERGATFVFLYNGLLQEFDLQFILEFVPGLSSARIRGSARAAAVDPPPHPAFREYITQHGQTDLRLSLPDGAEVLAWSLESPPPNPVVSPAAARIEFPPGNLYILPYQPPQDRQTMIERLVTAVLEHREAKLLAAPPFFEDLRVPGEEAVVQAIVTAREELERFELQHEELTKHKHLVGHFFGEQLENLVIEEMNLVLSGTEVQAHDVEERYVEDFVLADRADARTALAESKGASGGVNLGHVNQLNSHRSELLDATAEEPPGLLVVNTFRKDDHLSRRQEAVNERVVRHARRLNVLILRTWDLYQLVVRRLASQDDGAEILNALRGGGGWLEVTETSLTTHTE